MHVLPDYPWVSVGTYNYIILRRLEHFAKFKLHSIAHVVVISVAGVPNNVLLPRLL